MTLGIGASTAGLAPSTPVVTGDGDGSVDPLPDGLRLPFERFIRLTDGLSTAAITTLAWATLVEVRNALAQRSSARLSGDARASY
jgi:hypothetical protein